MNPAFALLLAVLCVSAWAMGPPKREAEPLKAAKKPAKAVSGDEAVTIFVTGHELGAMKPCGCSGGQLGGLDRRGAVLNRAPRKSRLVIDTGALVGGDGEQDLYKFSTIMRAFKLLGYDMVNLTARDVETARNLGLLSGQRLGFPVVSGRPVPDANVVSKFTKEFPLKGSKLVVTAGAFDVESGGAERIEEVFVRRPGVMSFNIVLLNRCDKEVTDYIAGRASLVDCVVCPADSDEPGLISEAGSRPLVFSVGRFGKYVNRLRITADKQGDGLSVAYRPVDVNEDLRPQSDLVNLYEAYQRLVREAGLLQRYPRFNLPDGLKYVGSESCKDCHKYAYSEWSTKAHARAYATLEEVGSQYDPECVICHVVGMRYEEGFISEEETGHLKDVGCENCHGPGSKHVASPAEEPTSGPKSVCTDCHTPEHSAEYAGKKQEYLEKIVHWKEPNGPRNVK